ncbi:hypothetical protein RFI_33393, partial [Reticulomyxa filosa]
HSNANENTKTRVDSSADKVIHVKSKNDKAINNKMKLENDTIHYNLAGLFPKKKKKKKKNVRIHQHLQKKKKNSLLLQKEIENNGSCSPDVFDEVYEEVIEHLRKDVYPRFQRSNLYRLYIQLKSQEQSVVSESDFSTLRVLGRGAFGFVYAAIKKSTGTLYAVKSISKKRILVNDSIDTIMAERDFLAAMHSKFVTGLKFAFMDANSLYLMFCFFFLLINT